MKNADCLTETSGKIAELLGLNFTSNQFQDLERRLKAVALDLNIEQEIVSINKWLSKPAFTNTELNTLSAHLTIGETYFFREKSALELFKQKIIPELYKQRQGKSERIRIWSAGCSSGEEPYTLAMIIKEHFPQLCQWDITILATDISPLAIQKALHGKYTEWSFRDTNPTFKNKYFTSTGKNWEIHPEIKKMVSFSYLNLSKNAYPSSLTNTEDMDVIFCRNVMMYFTPGVIHDVSHRFYNSINENGWLITSQVELNHQYFSNFNRIQFEQGIFYQKSNKAKESLKISRIFLPAAGHKNEMPGNKKTAEKKEVENKIKSVDKEDTRSKTIYQEINLPEKTPIQFFQKGEYQQCIDRCKILISEGKLNNEIFNLLVKSYANLKTPFEGEKFIEKIISEYSATSEIYYIYASFLKEQNDLQSSEDLLKKSIYLNHRHLLSHLMLGELLVLKDKKHLALKHFDTVLGLIEAYQNDDIIPDSDGLTASGFKALTIGMKNRL